MAKHANIPIFLPELACPHKCIFCNQNHISSTANVPTPAEADEIISRNLQTIPPDYEVQIAFFGGSFTGLPIEVQRQYLEVAQPYIASGRVHSIRLSTRPDYINTTILTMLKQYGVQDIELGAQSTNNTVLHLSGRGHNSQAISTAAALVKEYGFNLGLQMMLGLPGDCLEYSIQTAKDIVALGAVSTRIYPTLVVADTPLATLYKRGEYQPLQLTQAIDWAKEVYKIFSQNNVTVLKVGLHPNKDFTNHEHLLAGPFHPEFKELMLTQLWAERLLTLNHSYAKHVTIYVNPQCINYAVGFNGSNKHMLQTKFKAVYFKECSTLAPNEYTYCYY